MQFLLYKSFWWSFFGLVLFIQACNYNTLTFFFDGVPDPNKKIMEPARREIDSTNIIKREKFFKQARSQVFYHGPYKAKMCSKCHEINNGYSLVQPEPQLCFTCHENFIDDLKYVHGPVSAGFCSQCHHPHQSKNKFVLLESTQELCSKCHESDESFNNKLHSDAADRICIECHSPHGSNKQYLLL